ncbi:MAG: hypothetical protein U1F43_17260 [Myxococcota bacterium]
MKASEAGPRAVAFAFGRGAQLDEVMALLARPEAAVLHGGRPVSGAGCGPFRAASATPDSSGRLLLQAFAGHPEGRPWLDQIRVKVQADAESALATSFRYGEIDLAWEPVAGGPVGAANLGGGWASWMAVVRPG